MPDLIQILSEASGPRGNKLILTKIRVELSPPLLPWQPPNLQKSSSLNPVDGFQGFFTGRFLMWLSIRFMAIMMISIKKIVARGKGPIFLYDLYRNS